MQKLDQQDAFEATAISSSKTGVGPVWAARQPRSHAGDKTCQRTVLT